MISLDHTYLGISLESWLIAVAIAAGSFIVLLVARKIITSRVRAIAIRTSNDFDDMLSELIPETKVLFLLLLAAFVGMQSVQIPAKVESVVHKIIWSALLIQIALWGNRVVRYFIEKYFRSRTEDDDSMRGTINAVSVMAKAVMWLLVLLLMFDNLGFNVTALLTGLGIGGIAIALAVQTVLSDLFASLSIIIDKPFIVGDFIRIDAHAGTIEHIGLKTTRIRSLSGEQLVFSNADLLKSRIHNYKRMEERRMLFTVGVIYQTSHDQLSEIPVILQDAVERQDGTRFDRAHFKEFGDSAIVFEVVYFVLSPDYTTSMDVQQGINLAIARRFADAGIEFAYPTQTVFVRPENGSASVDDHRP